MTDTRDAPTTRQRMLGVAFDLFHAQGIEATRVEQVLEASGTGKSQLYHYFKSKDGLVHAVVEDFERRLLAGELPGAGELNCVDDLEGWFGAFVGFQRDTGSTRSCPMATIAAGLGPGQGATLELIQRIFAHSRGGLVHLFESLRERGELDAAVDPESLADFCMAVMQGGLVLSRVQRDPRPFERAVAQALEHVRALARG